MNSRCRDRLSAYTECLLGKISEDRLYLCKHDKCQMLQLHQVEWQKVHVKLKAIMDEIVLEVIICRVTTDFGWTNERLCTRIQRHLTKAMKSRDRIGWTQFLFGEISKKWRKVTPHTSLIYLTFTDTCLKLESIDYSF